MSLKKDHIPKNDYPWHCRVKKAAKRISLKNMRNRLKTELKKELK